MASSGPEDGVAGLVVGNRLEVHVHIAFGGFHLLSMTAVPATVNVWLQSRSLPARGRVGLEVHRCLCIIDAGNVFISTVMG